MPHEKRNPAENELTRFRRDLSRVAFSDEYAIGYAEQREHPLPVVAGCRGVAPTVDLAPQPTRGVAEATGVAGRDHSSLLA